MKVRCAHLTVQLVVRQGRDVKGIFSLQIEVVPRYERPHMEIYSVCGLFHILEQWKRGKIYDNKRIFWTIWW